MKFGGTSLKHAIKGDNTMYVVEWLEPTYSAEHVWQQSGGPLASRAKASARKASLEHAFAQDGVSTEIRIRRA